MTRKELMPLAKKAGIVGRWRMRKAQLIELLHAELQQHWQQEMAKRKRRKKAKGWQCDLEEYLAA